MRTLPACLLGVSLVTSCLAMAQAVKPYSIEQVLSAPFSSDLTAAPVGDTFAWVTYQEGKRNLFIDTVGQKAIQLTHYNDDDGQELSDLGFTPDGKQLVYVRGGSVQGPEHPVPNPSHILPDVQQQIWVVATDGKSEPKLLAAGRAPKVSPVAEKIAYINKGQMFVLNIDAPKPEQPVQIRGSQSNLRWSPDGNAIAMVTSRGDHSLIAVYRFDEKRLLYADPGTSMDGEPRWSPDSKSIAFVRNPLGYDDDEERAAKEGYPWQIRIANAKTGEGRMLWQADKGVGSLWKELASDDSLIWTAEDQIVFPWEKSGWRHLYSMHIEKAGAKELTPGEFEVEHTAYDAKKNLVYYSSNQDDIDSRHIWTVSPNDPKATRLTSDGGIEVKPVVTVNGTVAFLKSDAQHADAPATLQGLLSDVAAPQFPAAALKKPQQVIFPATDGLQIHGQIFLPTTDRLAKNGKHPAVLFIHGGSRRQMYLGFNPMYYYSNTYAFNQYLASQGYVVLSVNYRSGVGYGMAFRQATDYGFLGASEYRDIVGAAKYLQTRADVDGSRIGSYGGSYGGYLTALALARNSDIFKAGVDYHGVHDWVQEMGFYRVSDASTATRVADREKLQKLAWESSPMASLDTWKSPVLLIQGDDDRNVQFHQTVVLAQALRDRGVHVEEKVFPDEIHDFLLHRDWVTTYKLTAEFLDRELAGVK